MTNDGGAHLIFIENVLPQCMYVLRMYEYKTKPTRLGKKLGIRVSVKTK